MTSRRWAVPLRRWHDIEYQQAELAVDEIRQHALSNGVGMEDDFFGVKEVGMGRQELERGDSSSLALHIDGRGHDRETHRRAEKHQSSHYPHLSTRLVAVQGCTHGAPAADVGC